MTMTRPTDEGRTEQPALSALSAAVGAELGAGAADVVGIGVGSPVARLGAHGQRRREARGAAGRSRQQSVPSSAPGPPPSRSPSEACEGIPMQSLVQIAIGGGGRGTRGPQSAQSEP